MSLFLNTSGVGGSWPSAYEWANAAKNEWSWQVARNRFYDGLTLTKKTDREEARGKAFRTYAIHLVQDMAVSAHTRSDNHYTGVLR